MRNILKLLKFSILFQMRRRKSDIFEKTEIWIRTTYINTSFDRKFYADFKFSCHKFRRPRILKKTSLGEVSLYQDNNPLKYSQYHSSSWYKDTSPMPEYRYGTTCIIVRIQIKVSHRRNHTCMISLIQINLDQDHLIQ